MSGHGPSIAAAPGRQAPLRFADDLPVRSFMRETLVGDVTCDIPVRLLDRRLVSIECKASNTAVNSVKRINDTTNKASAWRARFGQQVVPALVISGVVDARNLLRTQDEFGVFVEFEHDLDRLTSFLTATAP